MAITHEIQLLGIIGCNQNELLNGNYALIIGIIK